VRAVGYTERMRVVLAALGFAAVMTLPAIAGAYIPDATFASLAPTRALADARAATEMRSHDEVAAARITELEATIARMQEAERREARIRDNVIQGRFEETDRKIMEVVGRLQLFVGCLIVLLVALFVWVGELARRDARAKVPTQTRPGMAAVPRSRRLG
jgi:hypothetical protein